MSQCMSIAGTGFSHMRISSKKILSHSAYSTALSKTIIVPPSVKTYLFVDFEFLEFDIQLASLDPSKTDGSLSQ